jgi:hypothetical protein
MARFRAAIILATLCTGLAFGDTIISDLCCNGTSSGGGGSIAVTWTQTGTFSNVSIGANLATSNGISTSTGIAYLLNMIGPGASSSNEVATPFNITVTGNPGVNSMTPLFSGLTLGPGTYYLAIIPTNVNQINSLDWDGTSIPVQILGTGVTQGPDELLAGSFNSAETSTDIVHNFVATGTPQASSSSAPEPATPVMILAGLVILAMVQRMRKPAPGAARLG